MFDVRLAISGLFAFLKDFLEWLFEIRRTPHPLNCLVELQNQPEDHQQDKFVVKIRGTIHATKDKQQAIVQIVVTDLTDGVSKAEPAHSTNPQYCLSDSDIFCYKTELGRLPRAVTTLSRWASIASIDARWLLLPRKGKRDLLFVVSIFSPADQLEIVSTYCPLIYDNPRDGYLDLQAKDHQLKILSARLALTVASAADELTDGEIDLVKNWSFLNVGRLDSADGKDVRLQRAFNKTIRLIRSGRGIDVPMLCEQIVRIASFVDRYGILDFCMNLAKAKGYVNEEKLILLNEIAERFEVEKKHFLNMAEKVFPPEILRVSDVKLILGIVPGVEASQARKLLNEQYRKWSARVTNYNTDVRRQAAFMLKCIAQARSEYESEEPCSTKG